MRLSRRVPQVITDPVECENGGALLLVSTAEVSFVVGDALKTTTPELRPKCPRYDAAEHWGGEAALGREVASSVLLDTYADNAFTSTSQIEVAVVRAKSSDKRPGQWERPGFFLACLCGNQTISSHQA